MWTKRQALVGKGLIALGLCAALVTIALPRLLALHQRDWPDQGPRPLIILATQGGDADYSVRVRSNVDTGGNLRFAFYLQSDADEDAGAARPFARFQVITIGEGLGGNVSCGEDSSLLEAIPVSDLDPGPLNAYQVDQVSSRASATNFREVSEEEVPADTSDSAGISAPSRSPSSEAQDDDVEALRYAGEMWGWYNDEDPPSRRSLNDNGALFVEECEIDSSLLWASTTSADPMSGAQATLFAPQFNLTSIESATDHQKALDAQLWVERVDGATVAEAYPSPTTHASAWSLWYSVSWQGDLGSKGNLGYTDQPTWLITNRDASRSEQTWLVFGGMAMGLALTLLVRGVSDLIDALARENPSNPARCRLDAIG